jgi:hypothetical protein
VATPDTSAFARSDTGWASSAAGQALAYSAVALPDVSIAQESAALDDRAALRD